LATNLDFEGAAKYRDEIKRAGKIEIGLVQPT